MLTTLIIKDFAIISELELNFDDGMTVLTGETGAGKSIIVSALKLLLGGKASPDIIRTGAEEAVVEGLFTVDHSHAPAMAMLRAIGIDLDDDDFVVRRVIPRKGRGRIYIGGTLQTVSTLRDLMRTVIDISGQHEHVSLLDDAKHLAILDRYACIEPLGEEFSRQYAAYHAIRKERDTLAASLEERTRRLDFLNYQIEELHNAHITAGEADEVASELRCLSNAETLQNAIDSALADLYDDENAVVSRLGSHITEIRRAATGQPAVLALADSLSEAMAAIEDVVHDLRRVQIENASPERIDALQNRLSTIDKIERKYHVKADNIQAFLAQLEAEQQTLVLSDERIAELNKQLNEQQKHLLQLAGELSKFRKTAAQKLSAEATDGLHLLAMENASIDIVCSGSDQFENLKSTGADDIKFLLCPNPGESPRPLAKIASGGELSRVLLALKRALVEKDDVACYVFDEVDTGIGGMTATHVAHMLKEVSRCHQVLCITHLASIASHADAHFRVSKSVVNDRTQSKITLLNESERVEEIARMLGGTSITAKTLDHAAEMIAQARESFKPKPD
ncbi:MAG: DNA repair protein RecN [Proteobacteria bacterium]|nr:DNA repair protein RecN [Pseudomonadota bacterium]